MEPPLPSPAGGAGTGLARFNSATASRSRTGSPEDLTSRADSTWPDWLIVKLTVAVPVLEAPGGKRLCRLRWATKLPRHDAGDTDDDARMAPAEAGAILASRCASIRGGAVVWVCLSLSGVTGLCRSIVRRLGGSSFSRGTGLRGGGGVRVAASFSITGGSGSLISASGGSGISGNSFST